MSQAMASTIGPAPTPGEWRAAPPSLARSRAKARPPVSTALWQDQGRKDKRRRSRNACWSSDPTVFFGYVCFSGFTAATYQPQNLHDQALGLVINQPMGKP